MKMTRTKLGDDREDSIAGPALPRRRFLGGGIFGACLATVAGRAGMAEAVEVEPRPQETATGPLDRVEEATLAAFAEALLPRPGSEERSPSAQEIASAAARRLETASPETLDRVKLALRLLECAPYFRLRLGGFSGQGPAEREKILDSWMGSRIAFKRSSFQALKWICLAAVFPEIEGPAGGGGAG